MKSNVVSGGFVGLRQAVPCLANLNPGLEPKNEGGSVKLVIIGIDHLVMLLSPFCYVDMAN